MWRFDCFCWKSLKNKIIENVLSEISCCSYFCYFLTCSWMIVFITKNNCSFSIISEKYLLLTLFLAHNFTSLRGNLFFSRIAILTNVCAIFHLFAVVACRWFLLLTSFLPIDKIEIWIQNFWCWLLLLHTSFIQFIE